MKLIKVAMCGAHSAGKTTAVMALAMRVRQEWPEIKVATVTDVARSCPWPLNKESTPEAQRWIFHRQIAGELEAAATGARIIICDRSLLDNLAYAFLRWNGIDGKAPWDWIPSYLSLFSESWLQSYSRIWFFKPGNAPVSPDGFRSIEKAFQLRVHEQLDTMLHFAHDGKEMRAREWAGMDAAMAYLREKVSCEDDNS